MAPSSPHATKELTTPAPRPGTPVAHDALAGTQDADAQSIQDRAELGRAAIQPPAGPTGPFQVADYPFPFGAVLQVDPQDDVGAAQVALFLVNRMALLILV